MGLGDDKGVVPRFCDEMFACIQSKEKKQPNVSSVQSQILTFMFHATQFNNFVQMLCLISLFKLVLCSRLC